MNKILIMAAALSMTSFSAFANDQAAAPASPLPACTGANSVFDVLGDKCNLVKGSNIYGNVADLSDIADLPAVGSSAGGGMGF